MPLIKDPEPRYVRIPRRRLEDRYLRTWDHHESDKLGWVIFWAVLIVTVLLILTLWLGFRKPHGDRVCYYDHNDNWTCQTVR